MTTPSDGTHRVALGEPTLAMLVFRTRMLPTLAVGAVVGLLAQLAA